MVENGETSFIINFLNKYHKLLIYCQKRKVESVFFVAQIEWFTLLEQFFVAYFDGTV